MNSFLALRMRLNLKASNALNFFTRHHEKAGHRGENVPPEMWKTKENSISLAHSRVCRHSVTNLTVTWVLVQQSGRFFPRSINFSSIFRHFISHLLPKFPFSHKIWFLSFLSSWNFGFRGKTSDEHDIEFLDWARSYKNDIFFEKYLG